MEKIRKNLAIWLLLALLSGGIAHPEQAYARRKKSKTLADSVGQMIDEALVKPPQDQEVCFAPEEPCDIKLVKFIMSAKTSLDLAIFDVTLSQLVDELVSLSKEVPVRVIVDKRQAKGKSSLVKKLVAGGVNVRFGTQRGIMHNKFTIVDGKMVETASYNYTNHATESNSENQVYLSNPQVVARYQRQFDKLWAKGKPVRLD